MLCKINIFKNYLTSLVSWNSHDATLLYSYLIGSLLSPCSSWTPPLSLGSAEVDFSGILSKSSTEPGGGPRSDDLTILYPRQYCSALLTLSCSLMLLSDQSPPACYKDFHCLLLFFCFVKLRLCIPYWHLLVRLPELTTYIHRKYLKIWQL